MFIAYTHQGQLDLIKIFERMPLGLKWLVMLRVLSIVVCLVVGGVYVVDLIGAQDPSFTPTTNFEVQQYERQKTTDNTVAAIGKRLDELETERRDRQREFADWKQTMSDRVARIETVGTVGVGLLMVLNTFGLIRKFTTEKDRRDMRQEEGWQLEDSDRRKNKSDGR